jgi:hypothetical protein
LYRRVLTMLIYIPGGILEIVRQLARSPAVATLFRPWFRPCFARVSTLRRGARWVLPGGVRPPRGRGIALSLRIREVIFELPHHLTRETLCRLRVLIPRHSGNFYSAQELHEFACW